jgi:hypothetical protein
MNALQVGGNWLAWWIVLAAAASQIGQFQAEMSSDSYQLMGMAERGFLPRALARRSRHGTPTYGIILSRCVPRMKGKRRAGWLTAAVSCLAAAASNQYRSEVSILCQLWARCVLQHEQKLEVLFKELVSNTCRHVWLVSCFKSSASANPVTGHTDM